MARVIQIISYPSSLPKFKTCLHLLANGFIIKEVKKNARPVLDGYEGEFLHLIADGLGISLEYYIDEIGWPTSYPENVTELRGCLGMVARGEVDFTVSANTLLYERVEYAFASHPYLYLTYRFVTKLPDLTHKYFAFLEPFSVSTWVLIFLLLLLMSYVFYLIQAKRLPYLRQFFNRFAEIMFQSPFKNFRNIPERILFCTWIMGTQFLALCYIAVILKFMIAPVRQQPVDTNEKLLAAVERGDYKVGTPLEINSFLPHMQLSSNSVVQKLASLVTKNGWEVSMTKETYVNLLKNNFALATTELGLQLYNQRGFSVIISKDIIHSNGNIVAYMSKNFTLREKFDIVILKILEGGLYTKIKRHYAFKQQLNNDVHLSEETIKPLTMTDMEGVFLLFSFGIFLSTVVFILEFITAKLQGLFRK